MPYMRGTRTFWSRLFDGTAAASFNMRAEQREEAEVRGLVVFAGEVGADVVAEEEALEEREAGAGCGEFGVCHALILTFS
jgi:hypothetical protein